jgi:tetratricopeptide (TPR) repeat protein
LAKVGEQGKGLWEDQAGPDISKAVSGLKRLRQWAYDAYHNCWRCGMKHRSLLIFLLATSFAGAQIEKIIIPAGTPEEKAIQAITAENDPQKRMPMWQDFLQKFSSNAQAVAYGNWQLSQQYLDQGDSAKALEYGDKALASQPNNLDILVSVTTAAQRAKDNGKIVQYAARGGSAFNGVARQVKPAGMEDDAFTLKIRQDQEPLRSSYEYLEAAGLNAIVGEEDPKKRIEYVERYMAGFPNSRLQEQVMQMAVYTLAQLKDSERLTSFAQRALAADPNGMSTLVVLAVAFAEFPVASYAARAEAYARKALNVPKAQTKLDESQYRLYSGLAHSALGYALMRQERTLPAITELKTASMELKEHADSYATALYRLGFAYAKTGKLPEAKLALTEAAAIQGPYQEPSRELLTKVSAAATKGKAK